MTCDHGHECSEARILPIGEDPSSGSVIVCRKHYAEEIRFRKSRNRDLEPANQFDLPAWDSLSVYGE